MKPRNEVVIGDFKCEPWRVSDTSQIKQCEEKMVGNSIRKTKALQKIIIESVSR